MNLKFRQTSVGRCTATAPIMKFRHDVQISKVVAARAAKRARQHGGHSEPEVGNSLIENVRVLF